ncbi:MAG: YbaB/EbfC family DNA-binding protein, partial [Rhodococcus fascians]
GSVPDFGSAPDFGRAPDFGSVPDFGSAPDERSDLDALDGYLADDASDEVSTMLFAATNPTGTVSVTVLMDGRILRVDLAPNVVRMTEAELGEEISVICGLAHRQARAAQHLVTADAMHRLGHDPSWTRAYLEREIGLPSPETVLSEKSLLFATRYAYDRE